MSVSCNMIWSCVCWCVLRRNALLTIGGGSSVSTSVTKHAFDLRTEMVVLTGCR